MSLKPLALSTHSRTFLYLRSAASFISPAGFSLFKLYLINAKCELPQQEETDNISITRMNTSKSSQIR